MRRRSCVKQWLARKRPEKGSKRAQRKTPKACSRIIAEVRRRRGAATKEREVQAERRRKLGKMKDSKAGGIYANCKSQVALAFSLFHLC